MTVTPGLVTEFDDASDSIGLLLWQVTNRWQAAQRAALKPFDLTHVQFVLLASLAWLNSDEPVTQKALSTHAATDAMMTSQVLRALEKRGLIARADHPTDARAKALTITPAGRALANAANGSVEACDHDYFDGLSDRPGFAASLRSLRQRSLGKRSLGKRDL